MKCDYNKYKQINVSLLQIPNIDTIGDLFILIILCSMDPDLNIFLDISSNGINIHKLREQCRQGLGNFFPAIFL